MTETIVFAGRKGGITKTTLTANTAAMLAQRGHKVLVVESDGQGSLTSMCGLEQLDGFYDLVMNDAEWDDVLREVPEHFGGAPFDILSASDGQRYLEQADLKIRERPLRAIIDERFAELKAANAYDVVLVDTGPGIHDVNEAFIFTGDWLVLPTLVKVASFDMLEKIFDYLDEAHARSAADGTQAAKVLGIQPNVFQSNGNARHADLGYLKGRFSSVAHIFPPVMDRVAWAEAATARMAINIYAATEGSAYERRKARQAANDLLPLVDAMEATLVKAVAS